MEEEGDLEFPRQFYFSKGKVVTSDANGNVIIKDANESENKGSHSNQALLVLGIVVGMVLIFVVGNYVLYKYAQKNLPTTSMKKRKKKRKKPVSKMKMKKERLKQGVSAPGD